MIFTRTGSEPNSPELSRTFSPPSSGASSDSKSSEGSKPRRKLARSATLRQPSGAATRDKTSSSSAATVAAGLKGSEMSVCRDCQAMIVSIIKSSRSDTGGVQAGGGSTRVAPPLSHTLSHTLGLAGSSGAGSPCSAASSPCSTGSGGQQQQQQTLESARAALRHFRLDLKPVYRPS